MTQQPKKSRRGLGRGLGALIQNTSEIEPGEENDTDSNESSEATQITDQAPAVDSTKPKDSIELRYLDGAKPARDRKRPSDLFFGDAGTSQTESTKHKASRAAMPNPILDRTRTSWDNEDSIEAEVESGDGDRKSVV